MTLFSNKSTWLEVDLSAIKNNVILFTKNKKVNVMAVVKANAYGHGSVQVARTALNAGAKWLAVARAEEALELRNAKITRPIVVLGFVPMCLVEQLISHEVSMVVWDVKQIKSIAAATNALGVEAKLHVKIDTGMGRIGASVDEARRITNYVINTPSLLFEGLMTHYACADDDSLDVTRHQETVFKNIVYELSELGFVPTYTHASNSAAAMYGVRNQWDITRLGIAMYGLDSSDSCKPFEDLKPALSWKSQLIQIKTVPKGTGISYGHDYVTTKDEIIGTVSTGYADGYRRNDNNLVLVGGKRVPVVGRVCMDQFMVNLDAVPESSVEDEVVMIGTQGTECITAEELADRWNTINYEVVSTIGHRVARKYI